jgi:hypothetical protein
MAFAATVYPRPERYWDFLLATLSTVLARDDASVLVSRLKKEFEKSSSDEQLALFHTEPLDVALMVTGATADPELVAKYLSLVKQRNWDADSEQATAARWRRAR